MCGSDLDIGSFGWSDYIWVFDNEPRNREIVERINKTISRGDQVIIWPKQIVEKDINDMALAGHDIMSVLESNTYSGLKAKVKFMRIYFSLFKIFRSDRNFRCSWKI